jgi:hypothetical protein
VFARAAILGGACVAVALGGCSLTPTSSSNASGFTGTKALIAAKLNLLASDGSSSNGSDICKNVLAPAVRSKLNSIGNCATIIDNQLKTIDDFTMTIKTISVAGKSATAHVQTSLNGTKVTSEVSLAKSSVGWRISSLGSI